MASLSLTEAQAATFHKTSTEFIEAFGTAGVPQERLDAIFADQIEWYDHAFHVCRVGVSAVLGLYKSFHHCNQPFRADIKHIHLTPTGAVVEQVWIGRCTNDIVRPDGQVAVKGTGKEFEAHVCMVLRIDGATGKIERIDEYYNKLWDEGKNEASYVKMTGASIKS